MIFLKIKGARMINKIPYAIKIEGLKKQYRLGQIGGGTLKGDLASWWAKVRGKEDPNLQIGQKRIENGDTFWALNGINITINPGERVGIIGRNGAGKSTLLKLLSRITAPTEGVIDIYGRISSMLEVGTGFNKELTGRENIYMNGAILGMTKAEIDSKMEDIIGFSEVRDFIDTPVKRYSSGMYVKLAFAVAAHLDAEIMIMDEVLAVGDMSFQTKCLEKMKSIACEEGRTILYVSHNMSTIRTLCERCIVLDEGQVIFDGDVEKAIEIYMQGDYILSSYREYSMEDYSIKNMNLFQILSTQINHNDCQYENGEDVCVKMKCIALENLKGVRFRFQIVAKNGTRVGSASSYEGIDFEANKESEVLLTLKTKEFFQGQYLVEIAIMSSTDEENDRYLNTLKNGFYFEILPTISRKFTMWHPNWGQIRLEDLITSKIN